MTVRPHASDEMLAAFADGRLNDRERHDVIEHAAACDDCREILFALGDAAEAGELDDNASEATVVRGRFRWIPQVLAVAAVLTLVAFLPPVREWIEFRRTGGMSLLIEATEARETWPLQTRLSGGFPVKEPEPLLRSAGDEVSSDALALARLKILAAANERAARDQHVLARAHLLAGKRAEALAAMKKAVELRGEEDPDYLTDLAAVYLENARYPAAIPVAERAWQLAKTPENAWNLAIAYEYTGERDADAVRMYREYLKLDASSPFATKAQEKIGLLTDDPTNQ